MIADFQSDCEIPQNFTNQFEFLEINKVLHNYLLLYDCNVNVYDYLFDKATEQVRDVSNRLRLLVVICSFRLEITFFL